MKNRIGPAPAHNPDAILVTLPADEIQLEQTLAGKIRDTIIAVPNLTDYVKIEARERFADNDEEDLLISTVPDQVTDRKAITSIIQIGIPSVEEFEKTNDLHTQLNFTYPITFDLEVVDEWDNAAGRLIYTNSRTLFMAVYMTVRRAFKNNRTLGFNNCSHDYLQSYNAGTVTDEETGGRLHTADWSLTVKCTGILV